MLPDSIYSYVWRISRNEQVYICGLIAVITPMAMVPLEIQRRVIDDAIGRPDLNLLWTLGAIYLAVVLAQGGLKFVLNITKGRILEEVTRDLRQRILERECAYVQPTAEPGPAMVDEGTVVSMLAAESEGIGGFASESLAVPLLQIGTIAWVMGYLVWVNPEIAALAIVIYAPQAILVPRIQWLINRLTRVKTTLVRRLGHHAVEIESQSGAMLARSYRRARILIEQIFSTRLRIYRNKFFLTFLGNFLDALGPIVVLIMGGSLVIHGQTDISTLVVFISGFQKISDPWDQLVNFYRTVSNARVTYGLVAEALRPTP